MKITRTIKFKEYILGYLEKLEVHEVRRIEKAGRLSRDIIKEESEKCGHKLMILDTIEKERRYECSLEDFLSVAREIPLKDQETVNTEEKNVQEDNSEDSKSKVILIVPLGLKINVILRNDCKCIVAFASITISFWNYVKSNDCKCEWKAKSL